MTATAADRAMTIIERCSDPKALRQIAVNARPKGELAVARAADLRRYAILPSEKSGTLEHSVWQSIYALEGTLSAERDMPELTFEAVAHRHPDRFEQSVLEAATARLREAGIEIAEVMARSR